jgi:ABC-type nitrate/sulfonate/bicarbonate transport system substrate-binding protein
MRRRTLKMKFARRSLKPIYNLAFLLVLLLAAACAPLPTPTTASVEETSMPTIPPAKVALGQSAVFDGTPMVVAQELGYFKDVGLEVTLQTFGDIQGIGEGLSSGSLNAGLFGDQGAMPRIGNLGNLTFGLFGDLFQGYAIVGRPGEHKTFEDNLRESGDRTKALEATMRGLEGETLITLLGTGMEGFLTIALDKADMSLDDLKILEMPSPEGATALIGGEGDLQLGDVPSRFRLEEEGMEPIISAADVGPPAILYVGYVFNSEWLDENEDTALRLLSAWYRAVDKLHVDREATLEMMYKWVNEESGTSFDLNQAKWIQENVSPWPTFEEAERIFYDPVADTYIVPRLEYVINFWQEKGSFEEGKVSVESASRAEQLYKRLKQLKSEAEANIEAVEERSLSDLSESKRNQVTSLLEKAKLHYEIRNYLDAARFSEAALQAAAP